MHILAQFNSQVQHHLRWKIVLGMDDISSESKDAHKFTFKLKIIILEWMNFQDNQCAQNHIKLTLSWKYFWEWMKFQDNKCCKGKQFFIELHSPWTKGTDYIQYLQ